MGTFQRYNIHESTFAVVMGYVALREVSFILILSHLIGNSAPVIALQIEPTPGCWHAGNRSLISQSWVNWVGFIGGHPKQRSHN